jgi:hypothetical protein
MELPDEVWIAVMDAAISTVESYKDALQILHNCTLVSKAINAIVDDWQIWKRVAQMFSDYARLKKRYHAIDIEWKTIVRERLSNVIVEREILVGDRSAPEKRYLIQVHGSGNMFIGSDVNKQRAEFIHRFTDITEGFGLQLFHDAIVKYGETEFIMMPYHMELVGPEYRRDMLKVVDVSTFDPFMLVLTETGCVIEFIFKPSWDTKWDEFTKPRMLEFPSDVHIEKIYAMDYAFMAIQNGFLWVWSVIDNPIGGENIRTPPLRLDVLSSMYVYYIEHHTSITRVYYVMRNSINNEDLLKFKSPYKDDIVDPNALYVDVENAQVMQIITASVFTEEQIQEIAEKIRTAEAL